jgi:hypothetical protein
MLSTGAIVSKTNGQCVDVYAGYIKGGVDSWGCSGSQNQKWQLNYTDSTNSIFIIQPLLDTTYALVASPDGTKIAFAKVNKSDINQLWQLKANVLSCQDNCSGNGYCSISTGIY